MIMEDLAQRLAACMSRIQEIARLTHRDPKSLRVLAVSKTHPAEKIRQLYSLGVHEFGENYAQELAAKREALRGENLDFVYIGTLQSNKIPLLIQNAKEVQSIASLKHAQIMAKEAHKLGKVPFPIYLLVNAGDESTKSGIPLTEVKTLAKAIAASCPELSIQGIMAIPPPLAEGRPSIGSPGFVIPPLYKKLREVASSVGAGKLSLGMSDDLSEAIAAGSDCVRIGTALFGPRA